VFFLKGTGWLHPDPPLRYRKRILDGQLPDGIDEIWVWLHGGTFGSPVYGEQYPVYFPAQTKPAHGTFQYLRNSSGKGIPDQIISEETRFLWHARSAPVLKSLSPGHPSSHYPPPGWTSAAFRSTLDKPVDLCTGTRAEINSQ
jgi:hypothetical protein